MCQWCLRQLLVVGCVGKRNGKTNQITLHKTRDIKEERLETQKEKEPKYWYQLHQRILVSIYIEVYEWWWVWTSDNRQ